MFGPPDEPDPFGPPMFGPPHGPDMFGPPMFRPHGPPPPGEFLDCCQVY